MDQALLNAELPRLVQMISYRRREALLLRLGLRDGFWYTLEELETYLKFPIAESKRLIQQAGEQWCELIKPMLSDHLARTEKLSVDLEVVEKAELLREAVIGKLPTASPGRFQLDADLPSLGMKLVGHSPVDNAFVAFPIGQPSVVVIMSPASTRWCSYVVATVYQRRDAVGEHRAGHHLGAFAIAQTSRADDGGFLVFLDIDLFDTEDAHCWVQDNRLDRTTELAEPWLFDPFGLGRRK